MISDCVGVNIATLREQDDSWGNRSNLPMDNQIKYQFSCEDDFAPKGSTIRLVVQWADTEKERNARKVQRTQSLANATQHSSMFGALPMGYVPPYNGYGYEVFRLVLCDLILLQSCINDQT